MWPLVKILGLLVSLSYAQDTQECRFQGTRVHEDVWLSGFA